jgi:poly(A)-specific ribonuclease
VRRIIYQEIRLRWPNKIGLKTKSEYTKQFIIIYKLGTKEEEEQREAERREKEKSDIKEAVGLSVLLRKIANSVSSYILYYFYYMCMLIFYRNILIYRAK